MSEQNRPLSSHEREQKATQIIHDAELLQHGAIILEDGRLEPTGDQVRALYVENVLKPQLPEFLNNTAEGLAITEHGRMISGLTTAFDAELGNVIYLKIGEPFPKISDFREWAEVNDLGLNFDRLQTDEDKEYLKEAVLPFHGAVYSSALDELALNLIQYPEYRLGSSVSIMREPRNGRSGYMEEGWKVDHIRADGILFVSKEVTDGFLGKSVSFDELLQWNNS